MEPARVFDLIADVYARDWGGELDRIVEDAAFVDAFAERARRRIGAATVLEVGAGPAQVGRRLASSGLRVVASDASRAQMAEARNLDPDLPLAVADLARLPVRDGSLGAVVAFYCLIYGPASDLDRVFADWRRALGPDGLVLFSVHTGEGTEELRGDRDGTPWRLTVVLRDPADMAARLRAQGFEVLQQATRSPYPHEMPAKHLFVIAGRTA